MKLRNLTILMTVLFGGAIVLQAQSPEGLTEAGKLFRIMQLPQQHQQMLDDIINPILQKHPELREYKPMVDDYLAQNFSWAIIEKDLAPIYAKRFSVEELKQLEQFFQTPTGLKFSRQMLPVVHETIVVFQQRAKKALPALYSKLKRDVINKKMAEFKR